MTRSQQEALRSEGINNRHGRERGPLGGHAALFMRGGLEIGRLSACVQTNHDYDDQNSFQQQISQNPRVGCLKKKEETQLLVPKTKSCKQDASSLLYELPEDQQLTNP